MTTSSSTENKFSVPVKDKTMQYYLYPPPVGQYEDVMASYKLFMDTLGKFHAAMGTKFKIPIVGGKDLDLHRLFMEVTSRGGIKRVLEDKKWREVTNVFNFPPSATNASFILRKYYMSLLHHFEQVYYFKAKAWTPVPTDTWQSTKSTLTSMSEMNKVVLPSPENQVTSGKRQRTETEEASPESSIGFPVTGIIDGKFESGYLCTVGIGGEQLQGVLYQTPLCEVTQDVTMVRCRRRRRKKSEIKRRDPAHPKPNRSGYNFFFAEQHARLKLLHTGKDRGISRMIGELWNNLAESEKAVYQEKAVEDKERYRAEMEHYREGFRREQLMNNTVPLQQQYFTNMMLDDNTENDGENSHQNPENDPDSGYNDNEKSSCEDEEGTKDKDLNLGMPIAVEMGAENNDTEMKSKEELVFGEVKKSFDVGHGDDQSVFIDGSIQEKSISVQENESLIENELKQDGKISDNEPMILDVSDENKTKLDNSQEKDFGYNVENLEKDPQVFQETEKIEQEIKDG
ncbi:hypothetical protein L2E82_34990 [Cichorium intybus]|uniref:Uncharacterized protein n=1 Tax=Cichorium intybus TaxID=13427 RepID=A0ACB9BN68_CICIN|nr:hypothetical protein L2E82_34990 [Cichorium intybus]